MPSPNINTTDTIETGRQKINAHFNDAAQHGAGGGGGGGTDYTFDVKKYGASGTGSGGATQDQNGFQAAINAANVAPNGGVVYIPPGDYWLNGGFVLDTNVSIVGAGSPQVTLNHTGNNSLFTSTQWSLDRYKTFQGFHLRGNTNASARGITVGNSWAPRFYDLFITSYKGSDGRGINFFSDTHWNEGIDIDHVAIRDCTRGISFGYVAPGTGSFSDIRIQHCLVACDAGGQTGLYLEPNVGLYSGSLNLRVHSDNVPTARSIFMSAGSQMFENFYQVYWEGGVASPGKFIVTEANTEISGHGQIYPLGSIYDTYNQLDPSTKIFLGPHSQAASSHSMGGEYASFRGSGNRAALHPMAVTSANNPLGGHGVVYGDNVACPVVFMYENGANAFQVIRASVGSKLSSGTVLLEVDASGAVRLGTAGPRILTGTGEPTDMTPPKGSLYLRKDGGPSTTLYVKTAAATWTAK